MKSSGPTHLVLYDGVCALCNNSVAFLLRIDRAELLVFAPLQGETANVVLARHEAIDATDTMVFVRDFGTPEEKISTQSSGVLDALSVLGGFWWLLSWKRVIPRPLRDSVYRWVARHRYRWFGKYEACPVPPPEIAQRFLP
jgi:predicted DCC family thiol-disulfide oxidoreductase YuxK